MEDRKFGNDSLSDWTQIGKGGFGNVYKAKHEKMGHYVAIKLLNDVGVEKSLFQEAKFQKVFSCKFVLRVYGIYEGTPPDEKIKQKGMVMEFMKRGSVKTLCENLCGPPPFALACCLIHEVALGMRFLHSEGFLHRDLKPENVMLSDDLHAQLADFGLCAVSVTYCASNQEETQNAGTVKYMPPEALDNPNYKPARSFDVYSFAIFLWAILSGEEPYPSAGRALVERCVKKGQRPPLDELSKNSTAGMKDLLDLMQKCWEGDPSKRPTFAEIVSLTENVFLKHEHKIYDEVNKVLKKLDSGTSDPLEIPEDIVDHPAPPTQPNLTDEEKANFVDSKMTDLLQKTTRIMTIVEELGDMVHSEASSEIVKQSTSYKKMIELWDGPLHSGGTPVKAAFYDALKKHEPELVKSLGMIYSSMCICCLKVIKSLTIFFPLRWLNPRRPKMFQITLFSEFFQ
ncbi:receptor-interacting serine/threonine-protein kinase 3 isoform X2 [Oryzias melastigma]|uniref:receptor-interacting serine/threonine-protein kinase 3 isoform X2 n=1 Tax=Oryzias melastigma TaxID=30732 RepID=UPI00168D67FD|nr:receptor-interacting serine/threonine-protein kinase 3 isoform X2 [Oryzias melastigma]